MALLLLVVGTVGMASMASVLSNRSRLVMDMEFGVQRRTAMRNTRVLCQSYFLSDGIGSTSPAVSLDLGGGWGKIAIPATTKSPFVSSQGSTLKNYLGPSREEGFSENVTVTLYQPVPYDTTGAETMTEFLVQLKSRSPLLAGNLLVQHYPSLLPLVMTPMSRAISK